MPVKVKPVRRSGQLFRFLELHSARSGFPAPQPVPLTPCARPRLWPRRGDSACTGPFLCLQHPASLARLPAAAGPPGEEVPVAALRVLGQAEPLREHEHRLRQQLARECPFPCHALTAGPTTARLRLPGSGLGGEPADCDRRTYAAYLLCVNPRRRFASSK